MQRRALRITILALLLLIGGAAGGFIWNADAQRRTRGAAHDNLDERLDRLVLTVADIGSAQQAYVAPGQSPQAAFEQSASQIQRVFSDIEALRQSLRSEQGPELIGVIKGSTTSLVEADTSARDHLRTDQVLWAAEIVYGQARDTRATMTHAIRALQAAESRALRSEDDRQAMTSWGVLGGAAAMWAIGLLALTWVPRQRSEPSPALSILEPDQPAAIVTATVQDPPPVEDQAPQEPARWADLSNAAAICGDISRLTSGDALPGVLARTAAAIDAAGIILWMGAGEELFAVAAHGYDERAVSRLGAISRAADNATAAAWRTGEMGIVAGDAMSHGALVAPMFGLDGAIGVLAAEVRHGREADPDVRAITAMIAAQLATVISAWPGPSSADAGAEQPHDRDVPLREASGL